MRLEIVSAADFLVQLLRLQSRTEILLSENQLELFKISLTELLKRRYRDHWFPDKPNRGSGYRCIRINGKMDPVITEAGINVGLLPTLLRRCFPSELTMWIDPAEVSYRIGENGSICVLFDGSTVDSESSTRSSEFSTTESNVSESHHLPYANVEYPTRTVYIHGPEELSGRRSARGHTVQFVPMPITPSPGTVRIPNYQHYRIADYGDGPLIYYKGQTVYDSCKDSLLHENPQSNICEPLTPTFVSS